MTPHNWCEQCVGALTDVNYMLIRWMHRMRPRDAMRVRPHPYGWCGESALIEMADYMGFAIAVNSENLMSLRLTRDMREQPTLLEGMFVAHLLNRFCVHRVSHQQRLPESVEEVFVPHQLVRYRSCSRSTISVPHTAPSDTLSPQELR